MSGKNIVDKIINQHFDNFTNKKDESEGIVVNVDTLLTHDVCGPPTSDIFYREFGKNAKVFSRTGVVVIPDHYIFTEDEKCKRNVQHMAEFAKEQMLVHFYGVETPDYKGVCHVALPELGLVKPGDVIFGTDSHTCTHGGLGAFARGVGNTEGGFIAGTGKIIMDKPKSMLFRFDGTLPDYVMGKDVILQVIGDIGTDGADFMAMEFAGDAIKELSVEERMSKCNMAIEAGGDGIIAPDKKVIDYICARNPSVSRS